MFSGEKLICYIHFPSWSMNTARNPSLFAEKSQTDTEEWSVAVYCFVRVCVSIVPLFPVSHCFWYWMAAIYGELISPFTSELNTLLKQAGTKRDLPMQIWGAYRVGWKLC